MSPGVLPRMSPKLTRGGARPAKRGAVQHDDIRVHGEVAYVTLTKGYVAVIDAADVPLVRPHNWHVSGTDCVAYAKTAITLPNGKRRGVLMHRLIFGADDGVYIDHRDGNGLSNRRGNLREATHEQNLQNSGKLRVGASIYRGVSWVKERQRWLAKITLRGKRRYVGLYTNEDDAFYAYERVAKLAYGEFYRPPTVKPDSAGPEKPIKLSPLVRRFLEEPRAAAEQQADACADDLPTPHRAEGA